MNLHTRETTITESRAVANNNDSKGMAQRKAFGAIPQNASDQSVRSAASDWDQGTVLQAKWINIGGSSLLWNEVQQGVQWFFMTKGPQKGMMYYKVVDEDAIPLSLRASYLHYQNHPMPREFFAENSAFGDIYRDLDSSVISEEDHAYDIVHGRSEKSMTEDFIKAYPIEIMKILQEVKPLAHLVSQIISVERQVSSTHYVFYHAITKTARIMTEFNRARMVYEKDYGNILQYLRSPDLFTGQDRPGSKEETLEALQGQAADHGPIRSHLIALSTSLFSNFHLPGESTLNFFLQNTNMSTPWEAKMEKRLPKIQNIPWWKAYTSLSKLPSGDLIQIIVPKDIVNEVILATTAGGTPAGMTMSDAMSHGAKNAPGIEDPEHLQGRLLLTSDRTKEVLHRIRTRVFSFPVEDKMVLRIQKLVAKLSE